MDFPVLRLDLLRFRDALKVRVQRDQRTLWDPIRRRYVAFTPEELVRQLLIHFLITGLQVSRNRISVEKQIRVHGRNRRYDLVVHDPAGAPFVLVECKRPDISLDQAWFDQIGRYNQVLDAEWLLVTNGPETVCFKLDKESGIPEVVGYLPHFQGE